MFKLPTVLILGAGASWPFGFPTGDELVENICRGQGYGPKLSQQHEEYETFKDTLWDASPPSIDTFLEDNEKFEKIGKIAISREILEIESVNQQRGEEIYVRRGATPKRENVSLTKFANNWYRKLFEKMGDTFDDFGENLSIITSTRRLRRRCNTSSSCWSFRLGTNVCNCP